MTKPEIDFTEFGGEPLMPDEGGEPFELVVDFCPAGLRPAQPAG